MLIAKNPYGDGKASRRIIKVILDRLGSRGGRRK
jgi:UDP-N-acetylglucosamine 2-epimerase